VEEGEVEPSVEASDGESGATGGPKAIHGLTGERGGGRGRR